MQKSYAVIVPNWNGAATLTACLDSLLDQSQKARVIVVDNGSTDNSLRLLQKKYTDKVEVIRLPKNRGFAGGVNAGLKKVLASDAKAVALFNNDAVADKAWLKNLVATLDNNPEAGIVASKILSADGEYLDSTGENYSVWGLPFPRGRGQTDVNKYDADVAIFGASGGASLYRTNMLKEVGLFDETFFAYYEDVDLSFRAQLYGWKILYEPSAKAYHKIGSTSSKIKGFTTYQTLKNLPQLLWKNVPWALMPKIWPRLVLAYAGLVASALARGQFGAVFKGLLVGSVLWPASLARRHRIQKHRRVSAGYINSIITHDLPPAAHKLQRLRSGWWRLIRKSTGP